MHAHRDVTRNAKALITSFVKAHAQMAISAQLEVILGNNMNVDHNEVYMPQV